MLGREEEGDMYWRGVRSKGVLVRGGRERRRNKGMLRRGGAELCGQEGVEVRGLEQGFVMGRETEQREMLRREVGRSVPREEGGSKKGGRGREPG